MEDKKWTLNLSANFKPELTPELKLKDQIDESQQLELKVSKDKVYASYELKF